MQVEAEERSDFPLLKLPKFCKSGPWRVLVSALVNNGATLPFGGTIQLQRPIYKIMGMKLSYLSLATSSGSTITGGFLWGLISSSLSTKCMKPPYIVLTATNTGNGQAIQQTALVGTSSNGS